MFGARSGASETIAPRRAITFQSDWRHTRQFTSRVSPRCAVHRASFRLGCQQRRKSRLHFQVSPGRGGVVATMFRNFFAALRFRAALRDLAAPEPNSRAGAPQQAKGAYLHCLTRVAKTVVYCFPSAEFGSTSSRPSITLVYSGPICCASVSALVPRASSALLSFF